MFGPSPGILDPLNSMSFFCCSAADPQSLSPPSNLFIQGETREKLRQTVAPEPNRNRLQAKNTVLCGQEWVGVGVDWVGTLEGKLEWPETGEWVLDWRCRLDNGHNYLMAITISELDNGHNYLMAITISELDNGHNYF